MEPDATKAFVPLNIAVLTISDTRSLDDDKSGATLADRLTSAGHTLAKREIVTDDVEAIRKIVRAWIADPGVDAIITTGGTGFTGRDVTPGSHRASVREADGWFLDCVSHAEPRQDRYLDDPEPRDCWHRRRDIYLLPAGFARRLPRWLGRHPCRATGLPHKALQFRGDHAAAG
jgi:hypothetical protein